MAGQSSCPIDFNQQPSKPAGTPPSQGGSKKS